MTIDLLDYLLLRPSLVRFIRCFVKRLHDIYIRGDLACKWHGVVKHRARNIYMAKKKPPPKKPVTTVQGKTDDI